MNAVRNVFGAMGGAIAHVRIWVFTWTVLTAAAVLVVWPAWRALDEGLSTHPGASFLVGQGLDVDLWRTRPELPLQVGGALVFALLFGAFVAGGVLATASRADRRFRFAQFLGEGGFLLVRNLRVLSVGLVIALLIGWGFGRLDAWLLGALRDVEPGAVAFRLGFADLRWIHVLELLTWARGLVFLGLVFTSKVAMAWLTEGRRSAVVAWLMACGRILRHPLRAVSIVGLWTAIWIGGSHAVGELTVRLLEVRQDLALGAVVGQVGILIGHWVLIGMLLSARGFLGATSPAMAHIGPAAVAE